MTAFEIVGAIVSAAAGATCLVGLGCASIAMVTKTVATIEARGEAREREAQSLKMHRVAWWFSEDPTTQELLANLAELSEHDARERWRHARKVRRA